MGQIGRPTLPEALDDMLARVAPFDLSAIFGFPFDSRPLLLHDGYRQHAEAAALKAYLDGAYLFDPFYTACTQNLPPGIWRMRELAPDEFFDSEFYSSREVHPCISMQAGSLVEEIGFLIPSGRRLQRRVFAHAFARPPVFSRRDGKTEADRTLRSRNGALALARCARE
ncbi:hypothetical protein [Sinorhizobium meliloti]|uniref:hypothetical protein n=1 Tax=Rhizobium meliloti TaxID=382 RepID=UPI003D64CFF4